MKLITFSGPPSAGKTSVILRTIEQLSDYQTAVVKFDCLTSSDEEQYRAAGVTAVIGYAGSSVRIIFS